MQITGRVVLLDTIVPPFVYREYFEFTLKKCAPFIYLVNFLYSIQRI